MATSLIQEPKQPDGLLPYLLQIPGEARADPQARWPLILFLHGAGERGTDLEVIARHGIPAVAPTMDPLPFIAASPQCPHGMYWTELTALLGRLLDELEETQPIDPDRIYVTGMSMGGFGTWKLIAETPERFAAAAVVCGGGRPSWTPRLAQLPIWVFHGSDDTVVRPDHSIQMVAALQELGAPVRFTLYDHVGHDSWTRAYADPELYAWLLRHRASFRTS